MSEYKILKVIGKGAFGDAYLGMHLKEQKQYVIKQVDIKNKSKQQKQHIFNQVKLLQQFHHINIVSYRDSFIDRKGLLNIVMQYCEGGDMNQIIQSMQGEKIPEDKLVYWMAQIALAIFYMHEKKILHRDLKSPNIFILKGNMRLGDFGISKVLDHVRDLAQTNIGTPYYMSPEQYNHKPYSYKSDIWAFGCILYEMCNQRRPFQANNIQALGMKVVRGNFPPVSECYSKDLRNLISDMLSKNPVKRPNIIEILLKPFVKKKVMEYMKEIQGKKDTISKQSLATFFEQIKKLGISLEQKKHIHSAKEIQSQRERSTSAKKNRVQEQKQKEKKQRQRKKEQLQNELKKHNQQRKQMAQKLKKIQEQRKSLMSKRKSEKSIKSIYDKVQSTNHSEYQSDKYNTRPQSEMKSRRTTATEESSRNLIGKVISQVLNTPSEKAHSVASSADKGHPTSVSKPSNEVKKQPSSVKQNVAKQQQKKRQQQVIPEKVIVQQILQNNDDRKTFKMEEQYEMEFEDCQPEEEGYKFDSQQDEEEVRQQKEFESKNRVPTFANDDDKLAQEVKEIQNLVFVSNQAVEKMNKKEHVVFGQVEQGKMEKIKGESKVEGKVQSKGENKGEEKIEEKIKPQQIQKKVENLRQEIKMKTQHINSIRNQLSNIDFSLSQSEDQQRPTKQAQQSNFKKKQFNPQHAKINDRINMLKQSATTILGTEMYKKFYQYLVTIKEKGRSVKRDYLEQVLGLQKIGAYHLVEQIARLNRMIEKIPKWLD